MPKRNIVPEAIAFPLKAVRRGFETHEVHDAQGAWIASTGDAAYSAYLAHASNAYPKLVEALREVLNSADSSVSPEAFKREKTARALLDKLGEA